MGRTWAKKGSSSDNSSLYKNGKTDGSSVRTNYHSLNDSSIFPYLYSDELLDEVTFFCPSSSHTDDPSLVQIQSITILPQYLPRNVAISSQTSIINVYDVKWNETKLETKESKTFLKSSTGSTSSASSAVPLPAVPLHSDTAMTRGDSWWLAVTCSDCLWLVETRGC